MFRIQGRTAAAIITVMVACMMGSACRRGSNAQTTTGPSSVVNATKVAIEGQLNLTVGQSIQLIAFVTHGDGTREDITAQAIWSADAPEVASVDRGLVRGVKAGGARIMATHQATTGVFSVTVIGGGTPGPTPPPTSGPDPGNPEEPTGPSPNPPSPNPPSPNPPAPNPPAPNPPAPNPPAPNPPAPNPPAPNPPGPNPQPPAPNPTNPPGPTPSVVGVAVTGSTNLSPGANAQLTAIATFSDGTRVDVTGSAAWASSHPHLVSVSAEGRVTGLGAGLCAITATFRGITARVDIQVTGAPVVQSLRITGATQVRVGQSIQLRVMARFSDGSEKDVTDLADWSCSNTLLGHLTGGLLRGLGAGTVNVVARYQGHSALLGVQITL